MKNLTQVAQEIRGIAAKLTDLPRLAELLEQVDDADKVVADAKRMIETWKQTEANAHDNASAALTESDAVRARLTAVKAELAIDEKRLAEIRATIKEITGLTSSAKQ